MFSDIGGCFTVPQLQRLARTLGEGLAAGGEFIAVHSFNGSSPGMLPGDQVHQISEHSLPLQRMRSAQRSFPYRYVDAVQKDMT